MTGALRSDGRRVAIHPADVSGRYATARKLVFLVLIAIYVGLPLIPIGGHAAVFLDIPERRFYLFGNVFSARDIPMTVFFAIGTIFALIVVTALLGRVWCGWGCPQTVFLDGVYRRIERWIQGPREKRIRRNAGPMTFDTFWRKGLTQASFIVISLFLAHVFLSYFVTMPALGQMIQRSPAEHPTAFVAVMAASGLLYANFAWFREQLCLVVCPYGRLQGVLVDDDTLVVGYDQKRGEPRGKAASSSAGACVDCKRCVVVCPTSIDIRDGFQLDCIGCTACIDACDDIMVKLKRPKGLIRYDSLRGLRGVPDEKTRFWRPRIWGYTAFFVVGTTVALFVLGSRKGFEAHVVRPPGIPFTVKDGVVYDPFDLHIINKRSEPATFLVRVEAEGASVALPVGDIVVGPMEERHVPVTVSAPIRRARGDFEVEMHVSSGGEHAEVQARFLGPKERHHE